MLTFMLQTWGQFKLGMEKLNDLMQGEADSITFSLEEEGSVFKNF